MSAHLDFWLALYSGEPGQIVMRGEDGNPKWTNLVHEGEEPPLEPHLKPFWYDTSTHLFMIFAAGGWRAMVEATNMEDIKVRLYELQTSVNEMLTALESKLQQSDIEMLADVEDIDYVIKRINTKANTSQMGQPMGIATLDDRGMVSKEQLGDVVVFNDEGKIPAALIEGVATLDSEDKIPLEQLPDEVVVLGDDEKIPADKVDGAVMLDDEGKIPESLMGNVVKLDKDNKIPAQYLGTTIQLSGEGKIPDRYLANIPQLDSENRIPFRYLPQVPQLDSEGYIPHSYLKNVATLDGEGKIPYSMLPGDVLDRRTAPESETPMDVSTTVTVSETVDKQVDELGNETVTTDSTTTTTTESTPIEGIESEPTPEYNVTSGAEPTGVDLFDSSTELPMEAKADIGRGVDTFSAYTKSAFGFKDFLPKSFVWVGDTNYRIKVTPIVDGEFGRSKFYTMTLHYYMGLITVDTLDLPLGLYQVYIEEFSEESWSQVTEITKFYLNVREGTKSEPELVDGVDVGVTTIIPETPSIKEIEVIDRGVLWLRGSPYIMKDERFNQLNEVEVVVYNDVGSVVMHHLTNVKHFNIFNTISYYDVVRAKFLGSGREFKAKIRYSALIEDKIEVHSEWSELIDLVLELDPKGYPRLDGSGSRKGEDINAKMEELGHTPNRQMIADFIHEELSFVPSVSDLDYWEPIVTINGECWQNLMMRAHGMLEAEEDDIPEIPQYAVDLQGTDVVYGGGWYEYHIGNFSSYQDVVVRTRDDVLFTLDQGVINFKAPQTTEVDRLTLVVLVDGVPSYKDIELRPASVAKPYHI